MCARAGTRTPRFVHTPSNLIADPNWRVPPQSAQQIAERLSLGRWAAPEFNKLLGHPDFDLVRYDEAGTIQLKAREGTSPEFAAAAYTEFANLLRGPDPPRFAVGLFGSVWVDLRLAGKLVRLALEPTFDGVRRPWGIMMIPLE